MTTTHFKNWHLGGNLMVQGYVDSLGRSVVFYGADSIPDEPTLAIFPASDEEWTQPVLWTPCPDVATAAIIAAVMEAHALRVNWIAQQREDYYGTKEDENSETGMHDALLAMGWDFEEDDEFIDYALKATDAERADAAASFAIAHLTGIKRDWALESRCVLGQWDLPEHDFCGTIAQLRMEYQHTNLFDDDCDWIGYRTGRVSERAESLDRALQLAVYCNYEVVSDNCTISSVPARRRR
jgi:hypothetical protein